MIYPAADKLDALESKYALVIVAAKRARQLKDGARRMNDSHSANPLTVALEEIAAGEIIPLLVGEPEKQPNSLVATPVLTGLVATSLDDDDSEHMPTAAKMLARMTPSNDLAELDPDADHVDEIEQAGDDAMEVEIDDGVEDDTTGFISLVESREKDADSSVNEDDLLPDDPDNDE